MRSDEWRTSEPKRASLRRECTSSVSSALPSASDTCVASARSARRSARLTRVAHRDEQDAAQLLARGEADGDRVRARARQADVRAQRRGQREHRHLVLRGEGEEDLGRGGAEMAPDQAVGRGSVCGDDAQRAVVQQGERARGARAEVVDGVHRGRVQLVALGRADERGAGAAQHALTRRGALLLTDQAGHAGHHEDEEDDRGEDDDDEVDVAAADLAHDLDGRRDERREGQQREADRRQARGVPGGRLAELAHRRVQCRGAPEEVEADPADVEQDLAVVGAVERHDAVDEVRDEQRDDARRHEAEGRAAPAAVDRETDGRREEQDVARRVGDRDELRDRVHRAVVDVRRDERHPRDEREAQGHDQRVDEPGAVALRVAAAHERQQADHERRVDEDVHRVADRRERHLAAEDAGVRVGVEVAEPEQREAQREEQPGATRGGPVAADAGQDRHDRRQPQHVHDRAAALERRHPDVQRAQQRAAGEQELPGGRTAQERACACHAACSIGGMPASQSSPRAASSSIASIAMSISASVFAAVTCRRKPTSCLGTSG